MNQSVARLFLIWAGLVIGVSLLATPAKFLAPDLSLAHALQVGRATFRVLALAETAMLEVSFVLAVCYAARRWQAVKWPTLIGAILAIQYLVLLPVLGTQTDQILAGGEPTRSWLHGVYVVVEVGKVGILLILGLVRPRPDAVRQPARDC